jgi:GNAT superfamily N-acetyltransferase
MSAGEMTLSAPTPEDVQYLEDRLYEHNSGVTGIADGQLLAFLSRDESGRIIAGICGNTWGGGCEIRQFWVEQSHRHRGLGTLLFQAAESEARRRGCSQMLLMTFSFQAPRVLRTKRLRDRGDDRRPSARPPESADAQVARRRACHTGLQLIRTPRAPLSRSRPYRPRRRALDAHKQRHRAGPRCSRVRPVKDGRSRPRSAFPAGRRRG